MNATATPLARLQAKLDAMPPVSAMAVRVLDADRQRLRLTAPLAANVNDKGCAFGGSLGGLMTLAAWAALSLRLDQAGIVGDVYVASSQIQFRAPVYQDLIAEAVLAADVDWAATLARLQARGRARIDMVARIVMADDRAGAEMSAQFAIVAPPVAAA